MDATARRDQRLQVLSALGRYDEVLTAVEALRPKMDALPLESEADEAIDPWNVRETLLDTGRFAALHAERWETALALNAEVLKVKLARRRRTGGGPHPLQRLRALATLGP